MTVIRKISINCVVCSEVHTGLYNEPDIMKGIIAYGIYEFKKAFSVLLTRHL